MIPAVPVPEIFPPIANVPFAGVTILTFGDKFKLTLLPKTTLPARVTVFVLVLVNVYPVVLKLKFGAVKVTVPVVETVPAVPAKTAS